MTAARPLTHLIGAVVDPEWRTMQQLADLQYFPTAVAARKGKRSLDRYFEQRALPGAELRG